MCFHLYVYGGARRCEWMKGAGGAGGGGRRGRAAGRTAVLCADVVRHSSPRGDHGLLTEIAFPTDGCWRPPSRSRCSHWPPPGCRTLYPSHSSLFPLPAGLVWGCAGQQAQPPARPVKPRRLYVRVCPTPTGLPVNASPSPSSRTYRDPPAARRFFCVSVCALPPTRAGRACSPPCGATGDDGHFACPQGACRLRLGRVAH